VADRLKEAGLECYGHNLESSKRFFPSQCTTHTYEDRCANHFLFEKGGHQDLFRRHHRHGRNARGPLRPGFFLKEVGANVVPINILNPIKGTPFEKFRRCRRWKF
jgi:biotin synthase